ncbi:hypothetical protein M4D68_00795 [Priestia aryabhattai]|uniref:hypothetical protein n=1 Tax=Priestia aryabhattai TaxID=412384 RepID=UPI00203CCBA3|nr:hypothetical protein [Priestia aryabhattai]MCM3639682.1 hypothetical protein [Priestia aryabhattai]
MTKTFTYTFTSEELNAMVVEYQETQNDALFTEIYNAVYPMANGIAMKLYNNSLGNNYDKDDFSFAVDMGIMNAVSKYDTTKAKSTNFTTSVKQFVEWAVSDHVFKPAQTKTAEFADTFLSLDKTVSSDGVSFMEAVGDKFHSTEVDHVFDQLHEEHSEDVGSLGNILTGLVSDFSLDASDVDSTIIKTWVSTVLLMAETDDKSDVKKAVNKAVEVALPEVTSATLRKKKSRALKKFNVFAQDQGFSELNLSHF